MNKPVIRLGYADFWPGFDPRTDYFTRIIERKYAIDWSDQPDFLIYSVFGFDHLRHSGIRIFYTGENVRPDFRDCDYAFSFDYLDSPFHYRLPYYARRISGLNLGALVHDLEAELARKTRFCTFVYSHPTGVQRNRLFTKLSRYKRVDSGGRHLNNVGGRVADKLAFLREGKFTIAFEHSSQPGYTTEKITDAFVARTMPIYWGNPLIARDFNARRFLNVHEFDNDEALIERIIELDRDDARYLAMLGQPVFPPQGNAFVDENRILAQFDRIFSTSIEPVARRRAHLKAWDGLVRPAGRRLYNRCQMQVRWVRNTLQARSSP